MNGKIWVIEKLEKGAWVAYMSQATRLAARQDLDALKRYHLSSKFRIMKYVRVEGE